MLQKLKASPSRSLHEAVRREKTKEADEIIHAGLKAQLSYLVNRLGIAQADSALAQAEVDKKELSKLAAEFSKSGMLLDILQLVSHYKQTEADSLSVEGLETQLKYLLQQLGGRYQLRHCLKERQKREESQ